MNFEEMFSQEIADLKRDLKQEATEKIQAQIPVDTGKLASTLEVDWEGDNLVALTDTEYDTFVRFGYVTQSGSIVEGRDFLDVTFDFEV